MLASIGGANSIDRFIRVSRGLPWTSKESISEDDLTRLGSDAVDVLIGHDAPLADSLTQEIAAMSEGASGLFGHPLWEDFELRYANAGQRMFHRAVEQVRPRMTLGGHYHFFIDSTERYGSPDVPAFVCRTIALNADGKPGSAGILTLTTLQFDQVPIR